MSRRLAWWLPPPKQWLGREGRRDTCGCSRAIWQGRPSQVSSTVRCAVQHFRHLKQDTAKRTVPSVELEGVVVVGVGVEALALYVSSHHWETQTKKNSTILIFSFIWVWHWETKRVVLQWSWKVSLFLEVKRLIISIQNTKGRLLTHMCQIMLQQSSILSSCTKYPRSFWTQFSTYSTRRVLSEQPNRLRARRSALLWRFYRIRPLTGYHSIFNNQYFRQVDIHSTEIRAHSFVEFWFDPEPRTKPEICPENALTG